MSKKTEIPRPETWGHPLLLW